MDLRLPFLQNNRTPWNDRTPPTHHRSKNPSFIKGNLSTTTNSRPLRPLQHLQPQHNQDQRARQDRHDVTRREQITHRAHKDAIDLANLGQLQRTRGAGEEETDDDKDGVVEDTDGQELGHEGE